MAMQKGSRAANGMEVLGFVYLNPDLREQYRDAFNFYGLNKKYAKFDDVVNSPDTPKVVGIFNELLDSISENWEKGHSRVGVPSASEYGSDELVEAFVSLGRDYIEGFMESFDLFQSVLAAMKCRPLCSEYMAAQKALDRMQQPKTL